MFEKDLFYSHLKYPVCILFAHKIPVTNSTTMNPKCAVFYILFFLNSCLFSGRNFAYDRALRVIEDEEYLDDIDFVRAHDIFSRILNIYEFFLNFLKGYEKCLSLISN